MRADNNSEVAVDASQALELVRREREKRGQSVSRQEVRPEGKPVQMTTARQRAFLCRHRLVVPDAKALSRTMVEFILRGNGTIGKDESERVRIVRAYQASWLHKRIVGIHKGVRAEGVVLSLRFHLKSDIDDALYRAYMGLFHPVQLLVRWENDQTPRLVPIPEIRGVL